ncbi:glycoside hydrolase family 2 TIM barrel-domain containing protein [Flavivirga sp. 57AJ16]|uniref:glycoside hydrolase family 2 TIM barrel-domain containing protein n=1 Tax=Flavivirga sp. 57AJ16 TaxID=3025307 RepID=UPI002366DDDC|nr:glycoside hydrolase family 2 TIM barrel-domain containing protein [Flavivirga sp. 57AJ16]MDD7885380.1 glycoside hydrolase family 2 TIM barrel-domain containing protein [Flavivirga sp. 57AJ16]
MFSTRSLFINFLFFISLNTIRAQQTTIQSINTGWSFFKGDINNSTDLDWQAINIPHSWNTDDTLDETPGYYRGIGWYKKNIYISQNWKDKDIFIFFEGANQETEVYVNGTLVGHHIGGYTAFNFNITAYLQPTNNEILVKVDNAHNEDIPPLSGDFSYYGGIYRDVYLKAVNRTHFKIDKYTSPGVFITTPTVTDEKASVLVKGSISGPTKNIVLQIEILDTEGLLIDEKQSQINKNSAFEVGFKNIESPKLWSPDSPYLYKVVATLIDKTNKTTLDKIVQPLGFRWFNFDAVTGFSLNGKPLKLIGASRHQDYKNMGNALVDALHKNDVELLKDMGGNFIRVAHYPQDPTILETCDRLGILAAVETPGNNRVTETNAFTHNSLEMQKEMIRQGYNHPSVMMWGYMNEVLIHPRYDNDTLEREKYYTFLRELAQKIETLTRQEDPNRYTIIAFHGDYERYKKVGLINIPKIAGWNLYHGWYVGEFSGFGAFMDRFHEDYPNTPTLITEYGAGSDQSLHDFTPNRFDFTEEYNVAYHTAYLRAILDRSYISGGIIWNLVEFNNEYREDVVPHINSKGILTTDRKPKDTYWFYKANLITKPFVKIGAENWTKRSQQANSGSELIATQPVIVFSNSEAVQLFLNGKKIGTETPNLGMATFQVPFKNGQNILRAKGEDTEDFLIIEFQVIPNNLKSKENAFASLNVSLGDQRMYFDAQTKTAWVPEKEYTTGNWGYVGGKVFRTNPSDDRYGSFNNIFGTESNSLYETQRTGITAFKADVPNGVYDITIHLAELLSSDQLKNLIYNLEDGTDKSKSTLAVRDFDILINDQIILKNISNNNYLKPFKAYRLKTRTFVQDNQGITINFNSFKGESILNAIQIEKVF